MSEEFDQSLSIEDLRQELESQLGAAMGQIAVLQLLLRKREGDVRFLREQLAARDAAAHAAEHATADRSPAV